MIDLRDDGAISQIDTPDVFKNDAHEIHDAPQLKIARSLPGRS
jgi:hypothetical protein